MIGRPVPRLEDRRFILGAGRYTDDVSLPGALHAAIVRSYEAHARITALRTERAARAPGVVAVLTARDFAADGGRAIPHAPAPADAIDPKRPAFDPARATVLDIAQHVLAPECVYHLGEPVALIVAESAAAARDALELVEVEYDSLPVLVAATEALREGAPQLWPQAPGNICLDARSGDEAALEAAFAGAHLVVEHEFANQRVSSAHMEPRAAAARYDAERDVVTLICGGQGALRDQALLAAALGIPRERVEVICPDVGGGFGTRSHLNPEAVLVAWAARRLQRPVRWSGDRSEGFLGDFQGRDILVRAALAFDERGRILALRSTAICNIGAYTVNYSSPQNFVRITPTVYHVPVATVRVLGVLTNTVPTNSYRGAGRPEAHFTIERLLDIAARRLDLDRIELRRRNLVPRAAMPYATATGLTYDAGDFAANMEAALEAAEWSGFDRRRSASAASGMLRGIGLANYVESPIGNPRERVVLRVTGEGVEIEAGTQSSGQGHETTFAQVVAHYLGTPLDRIRLVTGDTRRIKVGGGTQSNRSMRLAGTLLVGACAEILERAREAVARQFESTLDEVTVEGGTIHHRPSGDVLTVAQVATLGELTAAAEMNGRLPAFPTGCAICELEVDPATGVVRLLRYTQLDDVGQAINPLIVHGQTHGGIAQGVGQALWEYLPVDEESGRPMGTSFMDYAVPRAADLPALDVQLVEDPTFGNPLRVKGAGEGGVTPAPAAVINAVVDALSPLGIEHLDMPATPPRIWAAIGRALSR